MTPKKAKPLRHFLEDGGIAVIPTYDSGATKGGWKTDPKAFTTSLENVKAHWSNGIRRFQLHPFDNGLICLDIDRKNGKDGLQCLCDLGVTLPDYMRDGVANHPAYTTTPSGGYHLFFRISTTVKYKSEDVGAGLEVVHYNHLITAPGSWKDGRTYVFCGDITKAPPFPFALKRFLTPWEVAKPAARPMPLPTNTTLSLDDIVRIIDHQGQFSPEASRNRYCFEVARYARKTGIDSGTVACYLSNRFQGEDFTTREINGAVKSAYRGK